MDNLAEPILERNKERRAPRTLWGTQAMNDAVAAQKGPAPRGETHLEPSASLLLLDVLFKHDIVVAPCIRLKSEPPNVHIILVQPLKTLNSIMSLFFYAFRLNKKK
jgi:hypothetical protein